MDLLCPLNAKYSQRSPNAQTLRLSFPLFFFGTPNYDRYLYISLMDDTREESNQGVFEGTTITGIWNLCRSTSHVAMKNTICHSPECRL